VWSLLVRTFRGVIPGLLGGLIVASMTMYISYTELKQPQIPLDWAALILSGLTTGIVVFFIVWGHFQKEPGTVPTDSKPS
jgi:hypothetical protein